MFPSDKYGWTEVFNNCGNVAESIWAPFAQNTHEAEKRSAKATFPIVKVIQGSAIVNREIIFEDVLGVVVTDPVADKLQIFEQGKLLVNPDEYTVDLVNQKAVLTFDPTGFMKFTIIYFQTSDLWNG